MHLTRDEQSHFGLGHSSRKEICGDATPASPSFAHRVRVPATTHRRVPTERVLSSPHESRVVPSLLHYSDNRYIRLYDRLAPSIPLISARGAKISWILRHTKLSDFCAFAWWASGLIDAPWRSCPCTSPVSPLFYIARAVAVATPSRFAPSNRSLTTPPPSSSSEEAGAGAGGPADKRPLCAQLLAHRRRRSRVAGVALSNSFPWVFATCAPVLYLTIPNCLNEDFLLSLNVLQMRQAVWSRVLPFKPAIGLSLPSTKSLLVPRNLKNNRTPDRKLQF